MPMIMTHLGSWNTMFMGTAFIVDTQQSGPRGGDKLYSPNWFMASAEHGLGEFGEPKVQNLGVPAFGDKDVGGLNIAMNNTSGVCGVQRRDDRSAVARQTDQSVCI